MPKWLLLIGMIVALAGCKENRQPLIQASDASVSEMQTLVGPVSVSDPDKDPVSVSLAGSDGALFKFGSDGALAFIAPPNFERPADANSDNIYEVEIVAADRKFTVTKLVKVTVKDVPELPPAIESATLVTNASSPRLFEFKAQNGMRFSVSGKRDQEGRAAAINAVQISNIRSDSADFSGTSANAITDPNGRLREFFFSEGSRVRFNYEANGRIGSISVVSADGVDSGVVNVDYSAGAQGGATPQSLGVAAVAPLRTGRITVAPLSKEQECALLGTSTGAASLSAAAASDGGTTPVNISLRECGNPIEGARVFAVRARGGLDDTYLASDAGGGMYRAHVPIAVGAGASFEQNCSAVKGILSSAAGTGNGICDAFAQASSGAPQAVLVLQASCFRLVVPKLVAACAAAVTIAATYCEFGSIVEKALEADLCRALRQSLDLPSDAQVTYYALAYLPGGGRAESGRVTVKASDPVPALGIETASITGPSINAIVQPEDPNPAQGYSVRVGVTCRANADQVTVSVEGSDGYRSSVTCPLTNKQGGCVLNVPGAAAGVSDRITIRAGGEVRQLTIVF